MRFITYFIIIIFISAVSASIPQISLTNFGREHRVETGPFTLSGGQGKPSQLTQASIWYDQTYMWVNYTVVDTLIYSPYSQCDDHLYNYDVVECFIGAASLIHDTQLSNYIEIEVSPYNVLFVSNITNSNGQCSGIQGDLLDCASTKIFHQAVLCNTTSSCGGFLGYYVLLGIPWDLMMTFLPGQSSPPLDWRMNLFRIDYTTAPQTPTQYQAWSPDYANPACFHMPEYFSYVTLDVSP